MLFWLPIFHSFCSLSHALFALLEFAILKFSSSHLKEHKKPNNKKYKQKAPKFVFCFVLTIMHAFQLFFRRGFFIFYLKLIFVLLCFDYFAVANEIVGTNICSKLNGLLSRGFWMWFLALNSQFIGAGFGCTRSAPS